MSNSLQGKRVIVTRPIVQSDKIVSELKNLGAIVFSLPVIKVVASKERNAIQRAITSLDSFDWVVFTSVNGVKFFLEESRDRSSLEKLKSCKLAAIGPATSEALERSVRKPDLIPTEFVSDAMADAMGDVKNKKVLLARAAQARKVLAEDLRTKGAEVTELALYDVEINTDPTLYKTIENLERPDFITFTSSSTVHGFYDLTTKTSKDWIRSVPSICIGPITAKTLKDYGVEPYKVASVYTAEGIVEALRE